MVEMTVMLSFDYIGALGATGIYSLDCSSDSVGHCSGCNCSGRIPLAHDRKVEHTAYVEVTLGQ